MEENIIVIRVSRTFRFNFDLLKMFDWLAANAKYVTTSEFNKLTAENFAARLKQDNLVTKADFDNKPTSFNKRVRSNKIKYLEVQKKLNSLITKNYNFFLGRNNFPSNDGSQNMFVYQPTLGMLELKKKKVLKIFLVGNQMEYILLNLNHYILLSHIA